MEHVVEIKLKNKWAGTVALEIPSHPRRIAAMAKHGAHKLKDLAGIADKDEQENSFFEKQVPVMVPLWEQEVKGLIRKVCIISPNGSERVESVEEMECHHALGDVWMILTFQFISGFGPGKKKSQS